MCPLIILLFLAIKRRIGDYGFTEERYFDFVLACWLALVCLYFLISKTKNIKLIPISLCVVVLFSSFGPWGAFSVSLRSQMGRLNHYLGKNNMLNAGKIVPVKDTIPTKDENEISSITTYIVNVHGYHGLQGIFAQNLDSLIRPKGEKVSEYSFDESGKIIALMNLRNAESYNIGGKYFNYSASGAKAVTNISGFDYLIKNFEPIGNMSSPDSVVNTFDRELKLTVYPRTGKLFVQATNGMPIQLDLVALIKSITDSTNYDYKKISQDSLTLNSESQRLSVKCLIQEIDGNIYKDSIKIGHLTADILIKLK